MEFSRSVLFSGNIWMVCTALRIAWSNDISCLLVTLDGYDQQGQQVIGSLYRRPNINDGRGDDVRAVIETLQGSRP